MTTGTFYVNDVAACRGYYGTETVLTTSVSLHPPTDKRWTLSDAPNGTGLRLFSVSKDEWQLMRFVEVDDKFKKTKVTYELEPWAEFVGPNLRVGENFFKNPGLPTDRVWLLTTFKNLNGHNSHWGTKRTFGSMFEEIVGHDGISHILQQTSTDELCISYFMCHRANDIHNEMGDQPSYVVQNLVWNRRLQKFSGPAGFVSEFSQDEPYWVVPPAPIQTPKMMMSCMTHQFPSAEKHFSSGTEGVKVNDLHPLLFTIFDGENLVSYKFITPSDEHVRQFRSRTHNKFAALFIAENRVQLEKSAEALEQLETAKTRLFTPDELETYQRQRDNGKIEFFNQLAMRRTQHVVFDEAIYKHCDILKNLKNTQDFLIQFPHYIFYILRNFVQYSFSLFCIKKYFSIYHRIKVLRIFIRSSQKHCVYKHV